MHTRMTNFNNKLISLNYNQVGLILVHNTFDALLEFFNNAYGTLLKKKIPTIFLSFSKAFDIVDNGTFMRKLEFYGFRS